MVDELLAGQRHYQLLSDLVDCEWILTEPDPAGMALRRELGAGETAAITRAYRTDTDLLVLDYLQARPVATSLGLTITGTLGILAAAYRSGLLSDLCSALHDLQNCGFRISPAPIAQLTDGVE